MSRKKPEALTPGGPHEGLDDPLFDQGHVLQQVPTRPKPEGGSMPAKDTYLDGDSSLLAFLLTLAMIHIQSTQAYTDQTAWSATFLTSTLVAFHHKMSMENH